MKKATPPSAPLKLVRDPRTGEMLEVRGYRALEGRLVLRDGLDMTKPIYDQVIKMDEADARRAAKH